MRCVCVVEGAPVGKGRPRVTRYGTYTPKKTVDYEERVRLAWKKQTSGFHFPEKTPLRLCVVTYSPIPKSYTKKEKLELPGTPVLKKPDWDNIGKIICDALNGVAWDDDSSVTCGTVKKRYAAPDTYPDGAVLFCVEEDSE